MPEQPGLRRQGQSPLSLVQMRQQHGESATELGADILWNRHTKATSPQTRSNTLILYSFTTPA
ncbi:hypothetical protein ACFC08_40435, partial [Streptomyces sp. NPDC056112]|uniref:hypothetical protein n=1 Tax=Streptomyces sp. NPDC056112 TaxID=3345715 RepID=UPI0035E2AE1C